MAKFLDYTGLSHFKDKNDALYAKQDGSYEGMTSGNAEQLVSTVGVEDNAPYTFRTTGGSADVGDRMNLKAVVGGTVAWNQLVPYGHFESDYETYWRVYSGTGSVQNGVLTVTNAVGRSGAKLQDSSIMRGLTKDHVYFRSFMYSSDVNLDCYIVEPFRLTPVSTLTKHASIIKRTQTNELSYSNCDMFPSTTGATGTFSVKDFCVFDLTAMFGSTIADYVYTLESGTAGSGIAWLKKYGYFTKPYYPYAAANLQSVKTSAHKTIGFNQWDEEWEVGGYDISNGQKDGATSSIRCKNMIKVVPSTAYYFKFPSNAIVLGYDANGNYIGNLRNRSNSSYIKDAIIDIPNNCQYITFYVSGITTYSNDICINISWDGERDGEYEPYEEHTYALDDVELRGIPKLDASNNLYYDGDRYLPDGTVIRKRRQIVADGSTYAASQVGQSGTTYYSIMTQFSSDVIGVDSSTIDTHIITDKGYRDYPAVGVGNIYLTDNGKKVVICLFDQTLTTVEAVNSYLASNPITIEYELATPTTEAASPYQQTQIVDDFGTEEFVDAATRDFAMPVGHNTVYQPNLRAKLEMAPNSPDGDGDYLVRQTDGVNEYVLFSEVKELPDYPTTDGTYVLKCTVADGEATLSWVSE